MKNRILALTLAMLVAYTSHIHVGEEPVYDTVIRPTLATQEFSDTAPQGRSFEEVVIESTPKPEVEEIPEWFVDVPLEEALQEHIYNRCLEYNIAEHYELVYAVIRTESNYTPDIVSRTNDYGLMQINKCNHEWLGGKLGIVDFLDPYQNVDAGIYLLQYLLHKYEDPTLALMCYNLGEGGAAKRWRDGVYTTSYADKVLDYYNQIIENI